MKSVQELGPSTTVQLEPITSARFGWITEIVVESNQVRVDFENNPLKKPLPALLGIPLSLEELEQTRERIKAAKIEFFNGDPNKPILKEIYYTGSADESIHLKAKTLILEGTQKVVIKSGDVQKIFDGKYGELKEKADNITSSAKECNKIRGGSVTLN